MVHSHTVHLPLGGAAEPGAPCVAQATDARHSPMKLDERLMRYAASPTESASRHISPISPVHLASPMTLDERRMRSVTATRLHLPPPRPYLAHISRVPRLCRSMSDACRAQLEACKAKTAPGCRWVPTALGMPMALYKGGDRGHTHSAPPTRYTFLRCTADSARRAFLSVTVCYCLLPQGATSSPLPSPRAAAGKTS